MKLDKRLQTVAALAGKCDTLADIGSDHAYLPTYMLLNESINKAIVCDVNEGPLENGRNTCIHAGVENKCDFRLGSGLSVLSPGEADVITICGMGGELMKMLLENDLEVAKSVDRLVLQPQSAYDEVRKFLHDNGFGVIDEAITNDKHLYYRMILCSYNEDVKEDDFMYPSLLANRKDKTYFDFLRFRLSLCKDILGKIGESSEKGERVKDEMLLQTQRIGELLKLYES